MNPDATLETIRDLLRDVLDDPSLNIEPFAQPAQLPGWDSMTHVRLAVALQNTFRVRFTLLELEDLGTFRALASLIEHKLQGRG